MGLLFEELYAFLQNIKFLISGQTKILANCLIKQVFEQWRGGGGGKDHPKYNGLKYGRNPNKYMARE